MWHENHFIWHEDLFLSYIRWEPFQIYLGLFLGAFLSISGYSLICSSEIHAQYTMVIWPEIGPLLCMAKHGLLANHFGERSHISLGLLISPQLPPLADAFSQWLFSSSASWRAVGDSEARQRCSWNHKHPELCKACRRIVKRKDRRRVDSFFK